MFILAKQKWTIIAKVEELSTYPLQFILVIISKMENNNNLFNVIHVDTSIFPPSINCYYSIQFYYYFPIKLVISNYQLKTFTPAGMGGSGFLTYEVIAELLMICCLFWFMKLLNGSHRNSRKTGFSNQTMIYCQFWTS